MTTRGRNWWSTRWWWLVAGLAVFAVAFSVWRATSVNVPREHATYSSYPGCRTAQLRVAISRTRLKAGGREQSAQLTFTNTGPTCYLIGDAPLIDAVTGARHVPVGRGAVRDVADRAPVILSTKGSATATIGVQSLPPALFTTCRPQTTNGLVIIDGAPAHTSRYLAHVFTGVCANVNRDNVGASWYSPA